MGSTGCLPSDNVTIQWKGHADILAKGLEQFFREQYLVDMDVLIREETLKTHKMVLALFLPTFRKSIDDANAQFNGLNLDYVADGTEDVKALIEFVYTGTVSVSKDRLGHLGRLAEWLQFEGLSKAIGQLCDGESSANREATPDVRIKEEPKEVDPNAELSADLGYDALNEQNNLPGDDPPDVTTTDVIEDFVATLDVRIKEEPKDDDAVMESSVDQDFGVGNEQFNHPGDNPPDLLATDGIEDFVTSPGVPIKEEPKDDDPVPGKPISTKLAPLSMDKIQAAANAGHTCHLCGINFDSADSHTGHHLKYHKADKSYKCTACATELRKLRLGTMLASSSGVTLKYIAGPSSSGCDNRDKASMTNMVDAEVSTNKIVTRLSAESFPRVLLTKLTPHPPPPSESVHDKDAEDLKAPSNVPAKFSTSTVAEDVGHSTISAVAPSAPPTPSPCLVERLKIISTRTSYTCATCGFRFSSQSPLDRHIRQKHPWTAPKRTRFSNPKEN